MRWSKAIATVLAAAVAGLGLLLAGTASTALSAGAEATRIMALGDSITGSPGCWRALLWQRLQAAGLTDVDFVGTLPPQGCGFAHDGENEGHGGALVTNVADQNQLPAWLSAARPDIVLMHFGTNDVWSNRSPSTILAAYGKLVDQMRASNPDMKVLVAQIIPMNPSSCGECARRVSALNAVIPGWAADKTTARSPIVVVDQWTGFDTSTDTGDGVHPDASGDRKIADRWFPALTALLGPASTATPTATPTPTVTPTATPTTGGGCTATYKVVNQWPGGFQGDVTVKNTGTSPITGWTANWTSGEERVSQVWNATVTQSGSAVTAKNVSWNRPLAAGASTSFGFTAAGSAPAAPQVSCTAG